MEKKIDKADLNALQLHQLELTNNWKFYRKWLLLIAPQIK